MAFFTTNEIGLLSADTVRGAFLVKMDFVSGAKYVWNGETDLEVGGNTYLPLHGLGRFEGIAFSREPVSDRFTIGVEGLPAETETEPGSRVNVLSLALSETDEVEGQTCTISIQFFDSDWQTIGSPAGFAFGFMRKPRITRTRIKGADGPVQSISVGCENMFYNRALAPAGRYTDRDQQARYSGDLICQFQPQLRAKNFIYPAY
jgi:hypothetical protein